MTVTQCYDFWIQDLHHYTIEANAAGEPMAIWYDAVALNHPTPQLEWQTGQPQSETVEAALRRFREKWSYRRNHRSFSGDGARLARCNKPGVEFRGDITDEEIVRIAEDFCWDNNGPTVELDPDHQITRTGIGAWVKAWVWVSF